MALHFDLRLTPKHTLRAVLGLRGLAVAAQLAVLLVVVKVLELAVPLPALLAGVAFLSATSVFLGWRLKQTWPVTEFEVSLHLCVDILVLAWLLYHAGGSSNAFVSAFLVPIALAAISLRLTFSLLVTLLSISAYTFLLWFHVPLPPLEHYLMSDFDLHVIGMWVNFVLSAALLAGLFALLADNIRRRDAMITQAREDRLRNEHVVALGALAASAAHELSTPLSTVDLLADELALGVKGDAQLEDDAALLKQQVQQCKTSLSALLKTARHPRLEDDEAISIEQLLQEVVQRWQLMRPEITLHTVFEPIHDTSINAPLGLAQALFNVLNNAADASMAAGHTAVSLRAYCQAENLRLDIVDQGQGVDEQTELLAGRVAFSTKPEGSGIGLLLTHTTLSRWGGQVSLHRQRQGGTLTRLVLPLSRLKYAP